jgi:hypothetical protein
MLVRPVRFLLESCDCGIGAETCASDMAALRSRFSLDLFFCMRNWTAEGFSQLSCSMRLIGNSRVVRLRLSCDSFIDTYSARGSLDDRKTGSVRGISSCAALIGLDSAGIGLVCRAWLKLGDGRLKTMSSFASARAGEVGACVFSQTWVRDMGAKLATPKPANAAAAEATVLGVVFVRAAELIAGPESALILPAIAGVSNLSGLVGA